MGLSFVIVVLFLCGAQSSNASSTNANDNGVELREQHDADHKTKRGKIENSGVDTIDDELSGNDLSSGYISAGFCIS